MQCVSHRSPGGNTLLVLHGEKAAQQAVLNSYLLPPSQSVNSQLVRMLFLFNESWQDLLDLIVIGRFGNMAKMILILKNC